MADETPWEPHLPGLTPFEAMHDDSAFFKAAKYSQYPTAITAPSPRVLHLQIQQMDQVSQEDDATYAEWVKVLDKGEL